jgi:tRNA threonylcarbamoyladenosine biosynthesis protein TsaE
MMRFLLNGPDEQLAFGERLAALLRPQFVLYLEGDLGTGKTTLTRGLLRGLGHQGPARSPTYTLVEPYELDSARLYHLDLYRVSDPEELDYLGVRDLAGEDAVLVVEWPERGQGTLPPPDLTINIDYRGGGRALRLRPWTDAGRELVARLR